MALILKKKTKMNLFIMTIPIILLTVIRYGIGTDYFSYNYLFDIFKADSAVSIFTGENEIGFNLLIFIAKTLKINYHVFATVLTLVMLFIYFTWIYKSSKNWKISIMIFYGFFYLVWVLSAYRQGLVLAIATLCFYSKDIKLSNKTKIIITILLSTIHYSALIYLLLMLAEKINLSKKAHLIITSASVLGSFLIVKLMPILIPYIPVLRNSSYFSELSGTWSLFPSIIRLIFFVIVIFFYDEFEKGTYEYKILQVHLLGYPMYFLLKFSELVAGRFFVFTFILIVILLPYIYEKQNNQKMKGFLFLSILTMSTVYLYKDLKSYEAQVGFVGDNNYYTYQTIFNPNTNEYYNRYSILVAQEDYSEKYLEKVEKDLENNEVSLQKEIPVKIKNKYYVMKKDGKLIENLEFDEKPIIYNGIIEYIGESSGMKLTKFIDFDGEEVPIEDALKEKIKYTEEKARFDSLRPDYSNPKINEIPNGVRKYYNTSIDEAMLWHFETPYKYYLLEIEYYQRKYYFILDENRELLVDMMYSKIEQFDYDGIAKLHLKNKIVSIDRSGKVIWIEDK